MNPESMTDASSAVNYPTAQHLDSGAYAENSGWKADLYLEPAGEREDGIPPVHMHGGFGNIGTPMPAFHRRWTHVGRFYAKTVGESVLEALREAEDRLVSLSDAYLGDEWNGHNWVGRWAEDALETCEDAGPIFDTDDLRFYWDAFDWFGAASIDWEQLCAEAKIDPERALSTDDLDALCEELATVVEPLQEQPVNGTAEYAKRQAERWVAERDDDDDDDDDNS